MRDACVQSMHRLLLFGAYTSAAIVSASKELTGHSQVLEYSSWIEKWPSIFGTSVFSFNIATDLLSDLVVYEEVQQPILVGLVTMLKTSEEAALPKVLQVEGMPPGKLLCWTGLGRGYTPRQGPTDEGYAQWANSGGGYAPRQVADSGGGCTELDWKIHF